MPLPAQYLNWLFRDVYRKTFELQEKSETLNSRVIPAWMPIACPMSEAPAGYLKCNGAAFDKEKYPELAEGYPAGVLPDLRGEFIRGWDDGRRVDAGRIILSSQMDSIQHLQGSIDGIQMKGIADYKGVFLGSNNSTVNKESSDLPKGGYGVANVSFNSANVARSSNETRPRNIAFLYVVRAA
ncbi:phage tail protein [Limnobaculum parvum]|uniref:Phage tail protein n=2 Tax=Limnobaculum parvum TaxID=2172103 RepID=A0A2Y9U1U2_9GAMM|nr:phage tail protein [Limnobaculum parvum]